MRAVNLLPRDEGRARRQPGAVLLDGRPRLGAPHGRPVRLVHDGQLRRLRQAGPLDGAKAELLAIPPPEPPDTSQSTLVAEKDARLTVLGTALGNRIAWDRVLREVSLVLPEDVWLETMSTNGPDPAAAATPPPPGQTPAPPVGAFSITGYTYSHDGVARLLARLSVIPHLEDVKLGSSIVENAGQAADRQVCDQRGPAEGAGDVVTKQRIPKPAAIALVVVALLVVGALGYFVVISPKRSASADLAAQIEATETEIQNRRLAVRSASKAEPIRAADLFRVTKAMPGKPDMPGVLLELNRIARDTGIRFDSITPGDSADAGGYMRQPIDVIFDGSFFELSDFLYRVRTLVSVHNGRLRATGRLFTVRTLSFVEGRAGLPADQGDARRGRLRLRHRSGDAACCDAAGRPAARCPAARCAASCRAASCLPAPGRGAARRRKRRRSLLMAKAIRPQGQGQAPEDHRRRARARPRRRAGLPGAEDPGHVRRRFVHHRIRAGRDAAARSGCADACNSGSSCPRDPRPGGDRHALARGL